MANLRLNHIYKVYPNGLKAVNDFTMDIDDKEFIVFVGPSGCGKSTTLRMIAGLEEITAGELYIGDKLVNCVEPKNRDIAMVFQNYALYPHMTIYENIAFGLRIRKLPKEEIDKKVREAAEILGITEYLKKKPREMSGGQRQRVALGRAIVREPKVFLLDEPLSNLDAKLRTQMRSEIAKLHAKLQTTFIYVTHDQVEAMTMGTRIVVMKDGYIQQIDTPRNLYSYPCNKFVAGFIGTPQMNFYNGTIKLEGDSVRIKFDDTEVEVTAPYKNFAKADVRYLDGKRPVVFGIRSEHISVDPNEYPCKAKCRVSYTEDLGIDSQVYADFNLQGADTITESPTKVIVRAPAAIYYRPGEIIEVSFDMSQLHIFDAETEKSIAPRIPEEAVAEAEVKNNKLKLLGSEFELPPAIALADGKYAVNIPTDAMSFGGEVKANFIKEEDVNGTRLIELNADGKPLFVIAGEGEDINSGIKIDLKKCTFTQGNEILISPLPSYNELPGKIVRISEVREVSGKNGKTKKKKVKVHSLEIAGKLFDCPEDMAERIVSNGGLSIYDMELGIRFANDVTLGETEGITAETVKILDYGDRKYAQCKAGDRTVWLEVDDGFTGGTVMFKPDISKISVYQQEHDIRLV